MMPQLEKPQRTYVTVIDAKTRKAKSLTVYGATREQVVKTIEDAYSGERKSKSATNTA